MRRTTKWEPLELISDVEYNMNLDSMLEWYLALKKIKKKTHIRKGVQWNYGLRKHDDDSKS